MPWMGRKAMGWHTMWKGGRQRRKERRGLRIKATVYHCLYLDYYYIFLWSPKFSPVERREQFLLHEFLHHLYARSGFIRVWGSGLYRNWFLSRCCSHLNEGYCFILKSICAGQTTYHFPHGLSPVVLLFSLFYEKGFTFIINEKVGCPSNC